MYGVLTFLFYYYYFFVSVATAKHFLAVVLVGSNDPHVLLFQVCWALSERRRLFPRCLCLRIFANVQSLTRCNLKTFYTIAKQHFHYSAVSADQRAKGVAFCSILGKLLVGGDWSVSRRLLGSARLRLDHCQVVCKKLDVWSRWSRKTVPTMVPAKLSLLPQGIVHRRYGRFHLM